MIPYGTFDTIMADSNPQFASKCSAALCASVGINLVATTKYQPQPNDQVEMFIETLVARLRHYFNEREPTWDTYV